ncbi:replication endonuclease [Yersinia pekkanenii]|uniref:Phage replication protein (Endonuclease) n=1 Tax=Yersinia pekkanenii TaxID=1288385 RepID=A0A0T9QHE6_9GAMM|nr:replication endonuclease [Yersinia pekkanenii]CNI11903.1 phage replication protein (endonuclease) [Yersinia pekkanenii]CRY69220.1 phage replication protein (endonuclease) [Yersinia pekkanenii]
MTNKRGRIQPTPSQPYPGNDETFAGVYSWNKPKASINPRQNIVPVQLTPLAQMIAAYQVDIESKKAATEAALTDEERKAKVRHQWRLDNFEDDEAKRDITLAWLTLAKEAERHNHALKTQADLTSQPKFIRQPLQRRIDYLRREQCDERANAFLNGTIEKALSRLDAMRGKQQTAALRYIASREGLDGLLHLAELNKREVTTLATMAAAHMDMLLDSQMENLPADNATPAQILHIYHAIANEAQKLSITPPNWDALNDKIRRRGKIPYDLIPGALARLRCATWWKGRLWRLRCQWREEQLRAVMLVHKKASPYISQEALIYQREQWRRSAEFIRAHELVNNDGFIMDMEEVVNASASNPHLRYIEMMTTCKGLENLAEMRGDKAMFYTITCPSKYHATLKDGRPNPKWTTKTVRESSDYLVNLFAGIRKKLSRLDLRWYGVRIAEPHHDGTVHWHLMCIMKGEHRGAITRVMRDFAIREDRAELGRDIKPRFDAKRVLKSKGTITSYLTKYLGKNVHGSNIKGKLDKKTGKPIVSKETGQLLGDDTEKAVAWASLHGVQQFRFFGIPSRQVYRELRTLAGQLRRKAEAKALKLEVTAPQKDENGESKAWLCKVWLWKKVLANKAMDDVLAAADSGCMATYILKQGGVLEPRKNHLIRTAYIEAETPNDYGELGTKIYGIWSPSLGDRSRVCIHSDNWKMVRKTDSNDSQTKATPVAAGVDVGFDFDVGARSIAPRTRGNKCPHPDDEAPKQRKKRTTPPPDLSDFNKITFTQRREMRERLRKLPPDINEESDSRPRKQQKRHSEAASPLWLRAELREVLENQGLSGDDIYINALLRGSFIEIDEDRKMRLRDKTTIEIKPIARYCQKCCKEIDNNNSANGRECDSCT